MASVLEVGRLCTEWGIQKKNMDQTIFKDLRSKVRWCSSRGPHKAPEVHKKKSINIRTQG